jgi:hypothetical protein
MLDSPKTIYIIQSNCSHKLFANRNDLGKKLISLNDPI